MSFKSNFGVSIKEKEKQSVNEQKEFEEMIKKSGCKGSYMLFENFIEGETPNYIKIINENAKAELIPKWIQNFAQNFGRFKDARRLEDLKVSRINNRAILIGGGPSLEKNKHLLSKVKDADIFCCDRSLERINIQADFGVSVDAHPTVANYFKNDNYKAAILPATCDPTTLPDKYNYYYIPSIDIQTDKIMQLMTGLQVLISQGNVNGVTCALTEYLGYEELILIGYDLGYEITEKGVTRETEDQTEDFGFWYDRFKATGASEETIKKAYTQGEHPIYKTQYLSDVMFDAYRMGFYSFLSKTKCRVINASEGGSLFHSKMECKRLEEIIKDS